MDTNQGFVYIMSNTEYDGILKIGMSKKDPVIRADQLTKNTGALGAFILEWSKKVDSMELAESILHFTLRQFYYQKEFYKIDIATAMRIANLALDNFFENDNKIQFINNMKVKAKVIKSKLTVKDLNEFEREAVELEKELNKL